MKPRIHLMSVFVDDQMKALDFYTQHLGFTLKHDVPLGEYRWLNVVGPDDTDGFELLLEPNAHPAAKEYQRALAEDGIPVASFRVHDVAGAHREILAAGFARGHVAQTQAAGWLGTPVVPTYELAGGDCPRSSRDPQP